MPTFRNTLFHLHRQVGVNNGQVWLENSPSLLAQSIFKPNIFPYKYPNISQTWSFFTPNCLLRWKTQSVPKLRHIKFRLRELLRRKHTTFRTRRNLKSRISRSYTQFHRFVIFSNLCYLMKEAGPVAKIRAFLTDRKYAFQHNLPALS
jgi:hypothetical protein